MTAIGMNSRSDLHFQQKSAHGFAQMADVFAALHATCQRLMTHRWALFPFAYCLVRDPHSYRSVPSVGQPVSFFTTLAKKCRKFSFALVVPARTVKSLTIEIFEKGTKKCSRKHGSSQQLQHLAWPVAWKTTWNAALLALQSALWPLMRSGLAVQKVLLLAPQQVRLLTTLASPAKTSRAIAARLGNMNSRRGFASAAVLRSKDPEYV